MLTLPETAVTTKDKLFPCKRNSCSHSSRGQKSKVKVTMGWLCSAAVQEVSPAVALQAFDGGFLCFSFFDFKCVTLISASCFTWYFLFFPFLVRILPINLGTISIFQNDLTSRPLNLIKRERKKPPFLIWLYSQVLNYHTFSLRKLLGSKHSYFWLQKSYLYLIIRINHLSNIKANIARRSLAPRRLEDQMADSTSSSINHYCALWEIRF